MSGQSGQRRDGTWLVALGAAIWGSDALLRLGLAHRLDAATIVLAEHVVLVLVTVPLVLHAVRAARRSLRAPEWLAMLVIGAGASAAATVLFTAAFTSAGPITPLALQKLQPVFAVLAARLVLGERLTPRYGVFFAAAAAGGWLLTFPHPLHVEISAARGALLAVSAAALWAAGTVLGRVVTARLDYRDVTVLRFWIGLPACVVLALALRAPLLPAAADWPTIVALALLPGLLALLIYYRGLRSTPAARATIAELAFPVTAALVGTLVLHAPLSATQWAGLALVSLAVVALARHERAARRPAVRPPDEPAPDDRRPAAAAAR
ncbi:MAG: DMT family transporter [Actinomycetota bacterium]|nr:DMT family transporter [Actinomycetota bacterium]